MKRLVVFISGRGSNLQALLAADLGPGRIVGVVSDQLQAAGLRLAEEQGLATRAVGRENFRNRESFEAALRAAVDGFSADGVLLAGFMRVLSPAFVDGLRGRLLNIHPSLLPAFPGLHTHARALAAGVRMHGCTVHFVSAEVDSGPIIAQAAVPVGWQDSEQTLAARVLIQEHLLYPKVVRGWCEGRFMLSDTDRILWQSPEAFMENEALCVM